MGAAVIDAIGAAIDQPASDVVHYQRPADGLRDLIASTARRTTEREWAWRQVGLLASGEASPAIDPQAAVLCALRRFPRDAFDAVVVAVREVGVAAMHRLLGSGGWAALTVIVCAAVGYAIPPTGGSRCEKATRHPDASTGGGIRSVVRPPATRIQNGVDRSRRPSGRSERGRSAGRSRRDLPVRSSLGIRVRADPSRSGTVLELGSADRGRVGFRRSLPGPTPPTLSIRSPRTSITPGLAGAAHGVGLHTSTTHSTPPPLRASLQTRMTANPSRRPTGRSFADTAALSTVWAGLLFFLNTAADADIPRAILDDDALARRPLPDVLSAVAMHIVPAAADDPAVLGLSGQLPEPGVRSAH